MQLPLKAPLACRDTCIQGTLALGREPRRLQGLDEHAAQASRLMCAAGTIVIDVPCWSDVQTACAEQQVRPAAILQWRSSAAGTAVQARPPAGAFCSQIRWATGLGQPCSCTAVRPAAWRLAAAAPAARETGEKAAGDRWPSGVRIDCLHACHLP